MFKLGIVLLIIGWWCLFQGALLAIRDIDRFAASERAKKLTNWLKRLHPVLFVLIAPVLAHLLGVMAHIAYDEWMRTRSRSLPDNDDSL